MTFLIPRDHPASTASPSGGRRSLAFPLLIAAVALDCAPTPGGTPPAAPPPPELVAVLSASANPNGGVTWTPVPAATTTGTDPLVRAVPGAAVVLVFKTDAVVSLAAGATLTSPGRQLAQAQAGSIPQIRRLREADEGFYIVDSTIKSPADNILRWYISFEPPGRWREGRVFRLEASSVTLGATSALTTTIWLGFSPPSAPSGLTFSSRGTRRDISWTDNSGDESGFDILVSNELFFGYVVLGRVAADQTLFTTGDADPIGSRSDTWFVVCARGSWPRRCSLPAQAPILRDREVVRPCASISGTVDLTLTPLTEDRLLYRGFVSDPVNQPITGLPGVAGGLASTLENRSVLPYEVRSPDPGYVTLAMGTSVPFPRIEIEGPWTARLPATTDPLPANLSLRIGYCR